MHFKPSPTGPGDLDGVDSRIALAIWLSVKSCQGILFLPAAMVASTCTVGARGNGGSEELCLLFKGCGWCGISWSE